MFRSFSGSDALNAGLDALDRGEESAPSSENRVSRSLALGAGPLEKNRVSISRVGIPTPDRILDIAVASLALLFFAPLMVIIAAAVAFSGPGPVLFKQTRLGRGGRTFSCFKFRTMRVDSAAILAELLATDSEARAEWARDQKLRNDPRVFAVGGFLRRTSLDELPQLFNVLLGEMSIVGPRPIVAGEAFRYRRYIAEYFAVRPGITGLWQVSGRNLTTYRRRVACDVAYVRAKSASNDLRIMAMTVPTVLLARGAF